MADISTWSPTDESNTAAPPAGWPENMQPSAVNNSARGMMGAIRRWYDSVTAQLASLTASVATIANYLPLAGGTITGDLGVLGTVNSIGMLTGSGGVNATLYQIGGRGLIGGDASNTTFYDPAGSVALQLQAANSFYQANIHHFLNDAGGASLTIDTGGNVGMAGTLNVSGNITAPAFIGNVTVPASGPISTGGTVTGGQVTSTGNVTASGTVSGTNVTAASAVTGASIHSTGNVQADGALTGGSVSVSGAVTAPGGVYTPLLRGGNGNDSGVLYTAPTADPARHTLALGWDSTDPTLYEIIDNSFTAMIPWSETIKSIKIQADGGAPAGWHLAVFTGGLINYFYSDVASDARIKRGIADSEIDALAALQAVPVRRYEWRDEMQPLFGVPQAPVAIGLVAQDLLPTMPDCVGVSEGRDAPYPADTHVIRHDRFDAYFVRAIQQLAAQNAALTARVTALENAHV